MDTEWTCHCGIDYEGSDHCPDCGCEQYEMVMCGWEALPAYTAPDALQFVDDMERAGLNVEHYHGRYWWHGPAVRVDDLQTAMMETRVPVQWDSMGMGYIVYPVNGDKGVPA